MRKFWECHRKFFISCEPLCRLRFSNC